MFGNEELRPFLETPKLNLTFIQTINIGLKQRLMLKMKQNAYCHKINTLAEKKSTGGILCVFKSFQYTLIDTTAFSTDICFSSRLHFAITLIFVLFCRPFKTTIT